MRKIKNLMAAAVVAIAGVTICGIGFDSNAADKSDYQYGVIEETPSGNWIGADSLFPMENDESVDTDLSTEETVDKNVDSVGSENHDDVISDETEDVTVEEEEVTLPSDTTDVVEDENLSDSIDSENHDDVIFDETEEDNNLMTFELPQVENVTEYKAVVDSENYDDVIFDETTNETVEEEEVTFPSDTTTDVVEDENLSDSVDSENHDDVIFDETVDDNNFFVDFTDDFVSENDAEVKGDEIYETSTKINNKFYLDFVDDFVSDGDVEGDDIFPTPEPTPDETKPDEPKDEVEPVNPEPTPTPEVPSEPEIVPIEKKVPIEEPVLTEEQISENPSMVIPEKVPEVLGDSLFDPPKTGDTSDIIYYLLAMFFSFGILLKMRTKLY